MNSIKDRIIGTLGAFGFILWYFISIVAIIAPLIILQLPVWIDLILIFALFFLPIPEFPLWIWALVVAIQGPQDWIAITYYVLFAIMELPLFINFISSLKSLFR